jgi:hypothetical protein
MVVATTAALPAAPAGAAYHTVFYDGAGRARHIGLIGDSTLNAVRWAGTFEPLRRYNFTFDAEPCRRTTGPSCGTGPPNALRTLRRWRGRWGRVLVMMTGYNDPGRTFAASVDAISACASRADVATPSAVSAGTGSRSGRQ